MGFDSMNLTLHKKSLSATNYITEWDQDGQPISWAENQPVMLWKFVDENGDLWNTETSIDGTAEDAKQIILNSNNPLA
jgi:hypothetical protein